MPWPFMNARAGVTEISQVSEQYGHCMPLKYL